MVRIFGYIIIVILFCNSLSAYSGTEIKAGYDKVIKKEIAELSKLKSEIIAEQNRLKAIIAEYNEAKAEMEKTINRVKNKNYKTIGSIYGNTDPEVSAKSLSLLPTKEAAKILADMPGRKAGKILSAMKPSIASKITQTMIKLGVKSVSHQ